MDLNCRHLCSLPLSSHAELFSYFEIANRTTLFRMEKGSSIYKLLCTDAITMRIGRLYAHEHTNA